MCLRTFSTAPCSETPDQHCRSQYCHLQCSRDRTRGVVLVVMCAWVLQQAHRRAWLCVRKQGGGET